MRCRTTRGTVPCLGAAPTCEVKKRHTRDIRASQPTVGTLEFSQPVGKRRLSKGHWPTQAKVEIKLVGRAFTSGHRWRQHHKICSSQLQHARAIFRRNVWRRGGRLPANTCLLQACHFFGSIFQFTHFDDRHFASKAFSLMWIIGWAVLCRPLWCRHM